MGVSLHEASLKRPELTHDHITKEEFGSLRCLDTRMLATGLKLTLSAIWCNGQLSRLPS